MEDVHLLNLLSFYLDTLCKMLNVVNVTFLFLMLLIIIMQ